MTSWNPVMNFVVEMKKQYINIYGEEYLYGLKGRTVVESWADALAEKGIVKYKERLQYLIVNEYQNYVLFRYRSLGMGVNNFWNIYDCFYRECRSVVIDYVNEELVMVPFRKFFNINELEETSYDKIEEKIAKSKKIEFSNKLDGSMVSARWYNDGLIVSGSQAINPDNSWRVKENYKYLNKNTNYLNMIKTYSNYSFIFEMIHPEDNHVVQYGNDMYGLHLVGMRNCLTGEEMNYDFICNISKLFHVKVTELYDLTLQEAMSFRNLKKAYEAEGLVINIDGYRIKLKYIDYINIHNTVWHMNFDDYVLDAIKNNNIDDIYSILPDTYKQKFSERVKIINQYIYNIDSECKEIFNLCKSKVNCRKDFALMVQNMVDSSLQKYMFCLYDNKNPDYLNGKKYKDIQKYLNIL